MAWKRAAITDDELRGLRRIFRRRPRFLLDENIGDDAKEWMRGEKCNVKTVRELSYSGSSDEEIYQLARKTKRILVTRDIRDFWNDSRFPLNGSSGLIVLDGDYHATVVYAVRYFGTMGDLSREMKAVVYGDGTVRVKRREFDTGAVTATRMRFNRQVLEEWVEE
jgi:hypothetical protein